MSHVVNFVYIGGSTDHHCLNFPFIIGSLNNESLVEFILSHTELNTVTFLFLDFEINVVVVFKDDHLVTENFPLANQKQELPVATMFVNRVGQNEHSLERTFYRCFLPSFSSFAILSFCHHLASVVR
jgi:hypothetical protein